MATKRRGYGTRLYYSTDGNTYIELTDLKKVPPPGMKRDPTDTSHLVSTSQVHESIAGWGEDDEMDFSIYFVEGLWGTLWGYLIAQTTLYWRVTYPLIGTQVTNAKDEFQGWISKMKKSEISTDNNDAIMAWSSASGDHFAFNSRFLQSSNFN